MRTIKTKDQNFKTVALNLKKGRKLKSEAEKLEKTAKAYIEEQLKKHDLVLSELPIGESVLIMLGDKKGKFSDCIRIDVKPRNAVDLAKLAREYPGVDQNCRADFACVYFSSLVEEGENMISVTVPEEFAIVELEKKKKELEKNIEALRDLVAKNHNKKGFEAHGVK